MPKPLEWRDANSQPGALEPKIATDDVDANGDADGNADCEDDADADADANGDGGNADK